MTWAVGSWTPLPSNDTPPVDTFECSPALCYKFKASDQKVTFSRLNLALWKDFISSNYHHQSLKPSFLITVLTRVLLMRHHILNCTIPSPMTTVVAQSSCCTLLLSLVKQRKERKQCLKIRDITDHPTAGSHNNVFPLSHFLQWNDH